MKGEIKTSKVGLLQDETTCCVCLEILEAPCILLCGHRVCLHCTQKITSPIQCNITNNNNNNNNNNYNNHTNCSNNLEPILYCPQCLTISRAEDLRDEVQKQVAGLCDLCEKEAATRECINCSKPDALPLCLECSAFIHKGRMSSHTVNLLVLEHKYDVERCPTHGKKKTLFCEDDTALICGHCVLDDHKGHKASPVSSAAKIIFPILQERVANLPVVQHELKSIISKLDVYINEMLVEKTKQEQYSVLAISEVLIALEETQAVIQERIKVLCDVHELLALRAKSTSQIAAINTFKSGTTLLDSLNEFDVVKLYCLLPELSKIERAPKFTKPTATKMDTKSIVNSINQLQVLPSFSFVQKQDLIVSRRVELDPSKEHLYGLMRIERGGVLTSSNATPLILNVEVLEIEADGCINLNGKGHAGGEAIFCEHDGFANQGASPSGDGGRSGSSNGVGGGGGHGSDSFGSTGGGGGGYGTAGLVGATNTFCEDNEPGGSAGTTYGAPDLYFLHLGSGGGSGHPYSIGTGGIGGSGGGALRINAWKIINNGTISCCGEDGEAGTEHGSGGGGGSGGSIHLQATEFENKGKIIATGGQGGGNTSPSHPTIWSRGGDGGHGRIRVDIPKNSSHIGYVVPQPYVG